MRLIAYTSVSHFGFIVLGIFAFTSTSIAGSSFYMVNHGLSTGALFLIAGFLVARRGSQQIADFGGLQKIVPVLAGTFLVAGLSRAVAAGPVDVHQRVPGARRHVRPAPGRGDRRQPRRGARRDLRAVDLPADVHRARRRPSSRACPTLCARETWVVAPLLALMLVFGFVPGPALDLVRPPASVTLEQVGVQDVPANAASEEGSDQ